MELKWYFIFQETADSKTIFVWKAKNTEGDQLWQTNWLSVSTIQENRPCNELVCRHEVTWLLCKETWIQMLRHCHCILWCVQWLFFLYITLTIPQQSLCYLDQISVPVSFSNGKSWNLLIVCSIENIYYKQTQLYCKYHMNSFIKSPLSYLTFQFTQTDTEIYKNHKSKNWMPNAQKNPTVSQNIWIE